MFRYRYWYHISCQLWFWFYSHATVCEWYSVSVSTTSPSIGSFCTCDFLISAYNLQLYIHLITYFLLVIHLYDMLDPALSQRAAGYPHLNRKHWWLNLADRHTWSHSFWFVLWFVEKLWRYAVLCVNIMKTKLFYTTTCSLFPTSKATNPLLPQIEK